MLGVKLNKDKYNPVEINYELLKNDAYLCAVKDNELYMRMLIQSGIDKSINDDFINYDMLALYILLYYDLKDRYIELYNEYMNKYINSIKFSFDDKVSYINNNYNSIIKEFDEMKDYCFYLKNYSKRKTEQKMYDNIINSLGTVRAFFNCYFDEYCNSLKIESKIALGNYINNNYENIVKMVESTINYLIYYNKYPIDNIVKRCFNKKVNVMKGINERKREIKIRQMKDRGRSYVK